MWLCWDFAIDFYCQRLAPEDPGVWCWGPALRNGLYKHQGFEHVSLDSPREWSKGYSVCSARGTYLQDAWPCGAEPQREGRDLTVPVLLGIRRELSAEPFISEHHFSPRSEILHAFGTLLFVSSWNASGLDKSFKNLWFGCIQLSKVEALSFFLGSSSMASYSQPLVFPLRPYVTPNITIFSQIRPVETCWSPYNNLFISFVTWKWVLTLPFTACNLRQ